MSFGFVNIPQAPRAPTYASSVADWLRRILYPAPPPIALPPRVPAPAPQLVAYTPPRPAPQPVVNLGDLVREVARKASLPVAFVAALVDVESAWNPNAVNAATGDYGLFQLNRQHFGKPYFPRNEREALDPVTNARGALRLLQELRRRYRRLDQIASAYNAGPSAADRGAPFPNQSYVDRVRAYYQRRGGA